ncbi:hypothetical protein T8T21_00855 [Limimaricola variabilis]|uniref:hypothetical protein n=1 Tax=Limimaricola variabilis TaxID=1492771 RepID=UPI002AC94D50|nr:hypothetical protein [Limimaricola variabilis]WPY94708.1 hypothetical protein T8T21_00855 [Limimaricola variabilis]
MDLRIKRWGAGYAVFDGSKRLTAELSRYEIAEHRKDKISAERKQQRRPCLCCTEMFMSEGAHNRLCKSCRQRDVEPAHCSVARGSRKASLS